MAIVAFDSPEAGYTYSADSVFIVLLKFLHFLPDLFNCVIYFFNSLALAKETHIVPSSML